MMILTLLPLPARHSSLVTALKHIGYKAMNSINTQTQLYGVIGHPIAHSHSPAMLNAAFFATGINSVYLAFDVTDLPSAIAGIRALNIRGIAVTIPHKVTVMDLLDEIDDTASRIGAVNTITNNNGKLTGTNTDAHGAITALEEHTGNLKGADIVILGAGGAARAVAHGAAQKGATIHILNRTASKGEALAAEINATFHPLSQLHKTPQTIPYDILINTTSVGMHPDFNDSPIPPEALLPGTYIMDIIYNPLKTRLLHDAETRNCKTIDGLSMFVHQGARQFTLWTGQSPPTQQMRNTVHQQLTNPSHNHTASQ